MFLSMNKPRTNASKKENDDGEGLARAIASIARAASSIFLAAINLISTIFILNFVFSISEVALITSYCAASSILRNCCPSNVNLQNPFVISTDSSITSFVSPSFSAKFDLCVLNFLFSDSTDALIIVRSLVVLFRFDLASLSSVKMIPGGNGTGHKLKVLLSFFWNSAVDQRKPRHNISVATPSSNHPMADQTHRDSREKTLTNGTLEPKLCRAVIEKQGVPRTLLRYCWDVKTIEQTRLKVLILHRKTYCSNLSDVPSLSSSQESLFPIKLVSEPETRFRLTISVYDRFICGPEIGICPRKILAKERLVMAEDERVKVDKFEGHDFAFWKMKIEDLLYQKMKHPKIFAKYLNF
ncbi:hypothetical protein LXL04_027741 [Taraxacum kok-saghyz]